MLYNGYRINIFNEKIMLYKYQYISATPGDTRMFYRRITFTFRLMDIWNDKLLDKKTTEYKTLERDMELLVSTNE